MRMLLRTPTGAIGGIILLVVLIIAVLAPWISPYDPNQVNIEQILSAPFSAHWLGTDHLGRDILSRLIWGSRISLAAGVLASLVSMLLGTAIGILSGFSGGWVDAVIQRFVDALLSVPSLILMIAVAAAFGASLTNALIAIGISGTPSFVRLVRGQVLAVREREYVMGARALGAGGFRIAWKHILPNIGSALIVWTSLRIAGAILAEASLSFLGLGVQPPTPSWGSMIATGNEYLAVAWWTSLFPGAAVFLLVLGANLFGDGLRDLTDPRLRT